MNLLKIIYDQLLKIHGPQGWWPLHHFKGVNPTHSGKSKGYHLNNYDFPKNQKEIFEIGLGAILTQNTNWPNVEIAITNLYEQNLVDPKRMINSEYDILVNCIKPSGYFNQKTKKMLGFANFFIDLKEKTPTRDQLLSLWGIGEETADSILLYAYKKPSFVVDTYTKRIFSNLEIINEKESYTSIKNLFEKSIPKDFKIYQEYHALIVEHAKKFYNKKPFGIECPLKNILSKS